MKLGLYSITYLGLWYRGVALTLEQLIDRAREYGYAGIEVDGKRPHGNPIDLSQAHRASLRQRADAAGVDIYAVAANDDFSSPVPEQREAQLLYVRELIRLTADLGAPVLRIFAAWPGVTFSPTPVSAGRGTYDAARRIWTVAHEDVPREQTWDACRAALIECSKWAQDQGVTLALQNHPPVVESGDDMLRMIREVNSPALKACFDAPLAARQGVLDMRGALRAVGSLQVLSHFGGEYQRDADGRVRGYVRQPDGSLTPETFYADFVRGLFQIGYGGYLGYELCHPLPIVDGQPVGIEFADTNARLAAEYLRGVIAAANQSAAVAAPGTVSTRS